MNDDRIEHLLRGYAPPATPSGLDQRVLARAERMFARARARAAIADVARECANVLGFGYISYAVDLITATDAEYHVELI